MYIPKLVEGYDEKLSIEFKLNQSREDPNLLMNIETINDTETNNLPDIDVTAGGGNTNLKKSVDKKNVEIIDLNKDEALQFSSVKW